MLFSFAGYDIVRLVAVQLPNVNEAIPCRWLRSPEDLGNNQSLVGRAAVSRSAPLELRVRSSLVPTDPQGTFAVRILVINDTLGTVPFVYSPEEVIVGDNNTSGLGIIFEPATTVFTPGVNQRNDPQTYPESRLRVLGPQQRCVHVIAIPSSQIPNTLRTGEATVQAYYRGTNTGQVPAANPTPVYGDQGLYTGLVLSPPATVLTAPPPAS